MNGLRRILLGAIAWTAVVRPAFAAEPANTAPSSTPDRLATLVAAIVSEQDPRVAATLERIEGGGRQLLALRSYLRSSARLAERWSWTAEQIAAYEKSPEYAELQAEIERVRAAFAAANPDHELWVNPQVRNLDIQLQGWNRNESVNAAGDALLAAAQQFVASPAVADRPAERARSQLEHWLVAQVPMPTPTVAAPGLSPHGQMRAIDFQVQRGASLVAGTRTATIASEWDTAGWTEKLAAAVRTASNRFVGPLESPREPWHYTYAPESVAAR
jgi:hypothetical protein